MIAERPTPALAPRRHRVRHPVNVPMAQRRSRARQIRQLQKRNPMTAVVLIAACFATLAVLYLSSYAAMTAQGNRLTRMESQLRSLERQRDALRLEIGNLSDPSAIASFAIQRKMVRDGNDLHVAASGNPIPQRDGR